MPLPKFLVLLNSQYQVSIKLQFKVEKAHSSFCQFNIRTMMIFQYQSNQRIYLTPIIHCGILGDCNVKWRKLYYFKHHYGCNKNATRRNYYVLRKIKHFMAPSLCHVHCAPSFIVMVGASSIPIHPQTPPLQKWKYRLPPFKNDVPFRFWRGHFWSWSG